MNFEKLRKLNEETNAKRQDILRQTSKVRKVDFPEYQCRLLIELIGEIKELNINVQEILYEMPRGNAE